MKRNKKNLIEIRKNKESLKSKIRGKKFLLIYLISKKY